jgi:putative IMPACT (imprinted ancient) family translation regulator
MPIYGQILSFSHKHTCSGSQSFGGVKLGVGGLISAYKTTAQHTESCEIIEKRLISNIKFHLIIKT